MPTSDHQHDLVVWGATGVAGRLTAAYLAEQYTPATLSLALGGRSRDRLDSVAADLADRNDAWEEIPTVVGDATDPESLRAIAERTSVVCTTVGPYTRYGTPMVEACVEEDTDYCDLTGEVNWVRESVDRFHDAAVDGGTRIVHSCGFDSVPADIGTLLVQSYASDEYDAPCETVRIYVDEVRGGVSGGTLASMVEVFEAASTDPLARETLRNPYSLAPPGERDGVDPGAQRWPRKDRLRSVWTAPSPMAMVNERVVRRSNALLGYPWGREFRCSEVVTTGRGLKGAAGAGLVAGGLGLFTAAMSVGPLRSALQRYAFPEPGEGPTEAETEQGQFTVRTLGRGTGADGPFTVEAEFGADWGPGYGATARMLGESAVCLVREEVDSPLDGGVLTPASGIGMPLVGRLRDVGFTATVSEATSGDGHA
ncbi:saccharopine dehydrogenase NADP-binding domain-containing protein [Halolamina sp. CBA1230]|uniref:saccharopine dehydrogenase family protein n=1 Tax=Halolamina sp. CBA1230 TaxID=1853690 RepID=UPI0009A1B45A|nr:saccharopine dehydrogenase NADP-binding domain-containing protein [Halolamina sp. CBA1230]QKY20006.1 saccharopine dehydrogenase NADP-binding domain-containing protein [Halolamina sp. CBA1230]